MKDFIDQSLIRLRFFGSDVLWFYNWSVRARLKGWLFYIPLSAPYSWRCSRCGKTFLRNRPNSIAKHLYTECPNPPASSSGQVQYMVSEDGDSITCFTCGLTSYNPNDVEHKYCGQCHKYHEDARGPGESPNTGK